MNIYVPSNATEDSAVIPRDNNGGWNGGKAGISVGDGNYIAHAPVQVADVNDPICTAMT